MSTILEDEAAHGSGVYGSRGLSIVRGSGAVVLDDGGREYIDCTSMYGTALLGHAHPDVAFAIAEQAGALTACFGSWANDRRSELYRHLAEVLPRHQRYFLCNSGTEAVEGAIKIARQSTSRTGLVALAGGFHGRTLGALSLTFRPQFRRPFEPLVPSVTHVTVGDTDALTAAVGDDTAAVFVETVQGEAGVRPVPPDWLRTVERTCRDRGALLVVDEVQTGLGRTGRWFGFEHADLDPDIVCLAKGLGNGVPIGAIATGQRCEAMPTGSHGSTFGGNPIAAAAAVATLQVIERENLPERAAELGAWALDRLSALADHDSVREVRGQGLMLAVELRERSGRRLQAMQSRGVLALAGGPTGIRLLPPLTIERGQLAKAIDAIEEVL